VRKGIKIGIISGVVIIISVVAYYLASPLFVSTEVNEPLPTNIMKSDAYQKFITMNEEKMQAAKHMNSGERDQIMTDASQINNSIDETMDVVQQQQQQTQNTTTANILRTGSFVGVGDGIHNAE
jgi:hypothetical protein